MPTLSISKTYQDGDVLFEVDLDNIKNDIETFFNITKIDDSNVLDIGITASTKIEDATLSTGKIASSAITTVKIVDEAFTATKFADSAVTTAKITDANITTAKINDLAVTTAKINDAAVTYAKRSVTSITSSSCGIFSTSNTTDFDQVTNLSVSLTTLGSKLYKAQLVRDTSAATTGGFYIALYVNGTKVNSLTSAFSQIKPTVFTLASGTHTITARMKAVAGTPSLTNFKLQVTEE
jgi:hypothetical protein